MDFGWSEEDRAFRAQVHEFIEGNWRAGGGHDWEESTDRDATGRYQQALADHGWLTMAWPEEYGGRGASYMHQMIFNEESVLAGSPRGGGGASLVGPTLMIFGTEEQKQEHLPKIARNEVRWAQGYSEPGAGSDLASLQTRAMRDGDTYVINGQKIWTSGAQHSDWLHVLTRSDPDAPKHRGISYFMMRTDTPGISVRPLTQMTGASEFNETFFEDVRVPATNMIGEENRGWYVAATTLDFERSGVDRTAGFRGPFHRLLELVTAEDSAIALDGAKRHVVADIEIEGEVARYVGYRVTWMQASGAVPNYEASMAKVFGSEMIQRDAQRAMTVLGLAGALKPGSPHAIEDGMYCQIYLWAPSRSILAGTSEIQRNIIATRGLGLPRG
jgi:alkylation response protein AidB-like acyl-CoA dehydrogenase